MNTKYMNMDNKLKYSFDDEPIDKFCYDLKNKKIELHFSAYYDLADDVYMEKPCVWVLENWEYAKSRVGDELKLYDLNKHIGVFRMILYMGYNDNGELEMLADTLDGRYITFFFKDPQLKILSEPV